LPDGRKGKHVKERRFSEEQIIAILKEAEAGTKVTELCRRQGISDATLYIYGRLPRGKKVLGPGLAMIDCKHLSGVTTLKARPNGKSAHTLLNTWSASRAIIEDRV
jgi:putative transposase